MRPRSAPRTATLGTEDVGGPGDVLRAGIPEGAPRAVGDARVAPAATDVPGGVVEGAGAFGVERAGHGDHVVEVVALGQTGAEEDPADVDVVGDVALVEAADLLAEVAGEDL